MTANRPLFPDRFFLAIFGRKALIGMPIIAVVFMAIPWEWLLNFKLFREFKSFMYLISPNVVSVYHAGFVNPNHVASLICILNPLGFLLAIIIAAFSRSYLKSANTKRVGSAFKKTSAMIISTIGISAFMLGSLYNDGTGFLGNQNSLFVFVFEEISGWWLMYWLILIASSCTFQYMEIEKRDER